MTTCKVTREWSFRLQLSIITKLVGSTVVVEQIDRQSSQAVVYFSSRDVDWVSFSELSKHTDFVLDKQSNL